MVIIYTYIFYYFLDLEKQVRKCSFSVQISEPFRWWSDEIFWWYLFIVIFIYCDKIFLFTYCDIGKTRDRASEIRASSVNPNSMICTDWWIEGGVNGIIDSSSATKFMHNLGQFSEPRFLLYKVRTRCLLWLHPREVRESDIAQTSWDSLECK